MKKPLREQAVEYLQYLKEQGITHVPSSGKKFAKTPAAPRPAPSPRPSPLAPRPSSSGPDTLESIAAEIAACELCPLAATRQHVVPGQGALQPDIMFIGEGPGADEDEQGLAFVGRAGQLLTKMINAMGYTREQVFIGNIVKCRPPGNRVPTPVEMEGCIPYLKRQIAVIQPKLIVCLGATAARGLVNETMPIGKARGSWREFEGIPVMLTFHPAYLLRDPRQKAPCWADLKAVLARLGKTPPGKDA
ncbi:MAG TPA: uracil-DNA glycosylase [Kiritimatiellia bacterium]|nr:uracil-DNA glycosylase [Kiritimatiellia bacterium]